MQDIDFYALIEALFRQEWTAVLALAMPVAIWLYRNKKKLSAIDTWTEVKLIAAPAATVMAAGIGAGLDWETIVASTVIKLAAGLGLHSVAPIPVIPVKKEPNA